MTLKPLELSQTLRDADPAFAGMCDSFNEALTLLESAREMNRQLLDSSGKLIAENANLRAEIAILRASRGVAA